MSIDSFQLIKNAENAADQLTGALLSSSLWEGTRAMRARWLWLPFNWNGQNSTAVHWPNLRTREHTGAFLAQPSLCVFSPGIFRMAQVLLLQRVQHLKIERRRHKPASVIVVSGDKTVKPASQPSIPLLIIKAHKAKTTANTPPPPPERRTLKTKTMMIMMMMMMIDQGWNRNWPN